jgi:hypothetical protein
MMIDAACRQSSYLLPLLTNTGNSNNKMKRYTTNDNEDELTSTSVMGMKANNHKNLSPPRKKLKFGVDAILGNVPIHSDNDSSGEIGNESDDELRHKGEYLLSVMSIVKNFFYFIVRADVVSPISSSSSVSSSEPSFVKSPLFKSPYPARPNSNSPSSDQYCLPPSSLLSYSPFNYLSSNNNSNSITGSSRENSNDQQQQHFLHDRLLFQMAAANQFDGHLPPSPLWRPALRPFMGKYSHFLFILITLTNLIESCSKKYVVCFF